MQRPHQGKNKRVISHHHYDFRPSKENKNCNCPCILSIATTWENIISLHPCFLVVLKSLDQPAMTEELAIAQCIPQTIILFEKGEGSRYLIGCLFVLFILNGIVWRCSGFCNAVTFSQGDADEKAKELLNRPWDTKCNSQLHPPHSPTHKIHLSHSL